MKELPKEIEAYISEHALSILKLANTFVRFEESEWSSYNLNIAASKFENSQSALERLNLRGTSEHNQIVNTISVLKHLCQAMYGAQHLLESLAENELASVPISEGTAVSLHQETQALARDFRNPILSFSRLLLSQASEYSWGNIPPDKLGISSGFGSPLIDFRKNRLKENIRRTHISDETFEETMRKIYLKLVKADTILYSFFNASSGFDPSYQVTVNYLPSMIESGKSPVTEVLSLENIISRLNFIPYYEATSLLKHARTRFDDKIKRSNKETPELRQMVSLIEAALPQLGILYTCHHLCLRHLYKDLYSESQENLVRELRFNETPNDIQKAIILSAATSTELVERAYQICDSNLPNKARKPVNRREYLIALQSRSPNLQL